MNIADFCKQIDYTQWTGGCDIELGVPDYVIFTPRNISITETDAEELIDYLRKMSDFNTPLEDRFYPVYGEIKRIADESTEPTVGTLDKGYSKQLLPGRAIYLLEWPSGILSDRHIGRLNRYRGGCLIINNFRMLIGKQNQDGTMGALPVDASTFGGGFSGSGGDVQTMRLRIDLGPQDKLNAIAMAYMFKEDDLFENIIPSPEPSAPPLPAMPTNLAVTLAAPNIVNVTWDAVPHATTYRVYRSGSATTGFAVVGNPTQPTFVDNAPLAGMNHYRVIASNVTGDSPQTAAVSVDNS